ncbi:hypothetical protein A2U01_0060646, partial [Trifolium medium]|nr:hypothetical protein [Trifolium medium]
MAESWLRTIDDLWVSSPQLMLPGEKRWNANEIVNLFSQLAEAILAVPLFGAVQEDRL